MFTGKNLWDLIQIGGFTMYVLMLCSIVSLTVMIDRAVRFSRNSRVKREPFMARLGALVASGDMTGARELCAAERTSISAVALVGLEMDGKAADKMANAMDRKIGSEVQELERSVSILGTLGSTVVYIGLFGTVIGIINSFQQIAQGAGGQGGMDTVITGIAEALVCTATGILVAVPAVFAYNLFTKRVENFAVDMELVASETADIMRRD